MFEKSFQRLHRTVTICLEHDNDEKLCYFRIQRSIHALRQRRRWHDYDGGIRGRYAVSRSKTVGWVICSSRISLMHPGCILWMFGTERCIEQAAIHLFQRRNCATWWMKWIKMETVPSSLTNFCRWCRRRWRAPTGRTNFARRSGNKLSAIYVQELRVHLIIPGIIERTLSRDNFRSGEQ